MPEPTGPVAQVRELATMLARTAERLRAALPRLAAEVERVPWQGHAADAMRGAAGERLAGLARCAARHDDAAAALRRHAEAMEQRCG